MLGGCAAGQTRKSQAAGGQLNGTALFKEPIACTQGERWEFARLVRQGFDAAAEGLDGHRRTHLSVRMIRDSNLAGSTSFLPIEGTGLPRVFASSSWRACLRPLFLRRPARTACKGAVTRQDPEAVRAIIDSNNNAIERLFAVGHIDSAAMFFAEDVWQMPPNSPPLVGRDSYMEFWSQATTWGTWQFDLDVQDVVASDSIAVERGKYTLRFDAGSESPIP